MPARKTAHPARMACHGRVTTRMTQPPPRRRAAGPGEPSPVGGLGERGEVRDEVVEQHAEGREADRAAEIDGEHQRASTTRRPRCSARCGTGSVGCTAARSRGRSPSRAMANVVRPIPAMSASSAPERRGRAADGHERRRRTPVGGRRAIGERCGGGGDAAGPQRGEHGDRDHGVDHDRDAERDHDRAGDRAGRVADLFADRRDAGVPGEREEQQAGRLQDPVLDAAVATRGRAVRRRARVPPSARPTPRRGPPARRPRCTRVSRACG